VLHNKYSVENKKMKRYFSGHASGGSEVRYQEIFKNSQGIIIEKF